MPQGQSHAGSFMPLLHRLVADGHNVSIYYDSYSPVPAFGGGVESELIEIKDMQNPFAREDFGSILWEGTFHFTHMIFPYKFASDSCNHVLRQHSDEFWRIVNRSRHLILTDSLFSPCGYAIAQVKKQPYIIMHSSDLETSHATVRGYARNYGIIARSYMPYLNPDFNVKHFTDRLSSTVEWIGLLTVVFGIANHVMRQTIAEVGVDFNYPDFLSRAAFSFVDMPRTIEMPAPFTNDIYSFGANCRHAKALTGDFEDFVSDPKSRGTILIAFGTIINWELSPAAKFEAFVDALKQLNDYRIIWAYNGPKVAIASHVMLHPWVPQNDILADNRTVLFVSHGGLKSMKEAVCAQMPTLFMPMFAEQIRNAWLSRQYGFAEMINKHELTAKYLLEKMRKMLENQEYRKKARRLRRFYDDQPIQALDGGAFWMRRLAKFGGKFPSWFYPRSARMDMITFSNLDFFLVISFLCLLASIA